MLKLELRAEALARPGYAQLMIRNWNGETSGTTLSIQRNQDQRFLAQDGQWVGSEIHHSLAALQEDGDRLWTLLGPEIVDSLLAERQMAYRLTLSDGSAIDRGGLVIANDVMSSMASGSTQSPNRVIAVSEPSPEPVILPEVTPEPDVVVQPEVKPDPVVVPPPVAPAKKKSLLWLWLLIAMLIIAAAVIWYLLKPSASTVALAPATEAPAAAPAPVGGCSAEAMTSSSELEFVKSCLKTQPNDTQVQEIIKQAKDKKRCDVAQRLYAYKAQSGDIKLALSYAHEYDPETATSGGCFTADAETAVYWYQAVIAKDPNNADAQARLGALKK